MEPDSRTGPLVVIIGGGITGLATAFCLKQLGTSVRVLEKKQRVGGTIQTEFRDGYLIDTGPNSALETSPKIQTMLTELGIIDQHTYANPVSDNRYILRNGTLHALPLHPVKFLRSGLFSTKAKIRLLFEPFIPPLRDGDEESIADFVQRRIGKEFLDYAINPFIAGVYAGNPRELSVKYAVPKVYAMEQNYGSLIKGTIRGRKERKKKSETSKHAARLFSFIKGMEEFPNALERKLKDAISTNVTVSSISYSKETKQYSISYMTNNHNHTEIADTVFLGIPTYDAAEYVQPFSPELAATLRNIPYVPVAVVFFGAPKHQCKHTLHGFGFLVPEVEKRTILGTIWSSSLFPGRAPTDHIALTTFVGGARQPDLVALDDNAMIRLVQNELGKIIGFAGNPSFIHIRRWSKAIPQYVIGYGKVLSAVDAFENAQPGFFIGGNFRHGIGIGDCIKSSYEMAEKIQLYLKTRS